jgi:hypothetical protein
VAGPLGMADDLSETRPWGERLRTWREDVKHWSRAEFRDEVVAAAYRLGENRGQQLDERLIGRWENGDVLRPQSVYRRLLAHLGAPLPSSFPPPPNSSLYHVSWIPWKPGAYALTSTCYAQNWKTT